MIPGYQWWRLSRLAKSTRRGTPLAANEYRDKFHPSIRCYGIQTGHSERTLMIPLHDGEIHEKRTNTNLLGVQLGFSIEKLTVVFNVFLGAPPRAPPIFL